LLDKRLLLYGNLEYLSKPHDPAQEHHPCREHRVPGSLRGVNDKQEARMRKPRSGELRSGCFNQEAIESRYREACRIVEAGFKPGRLEKLRRCLRPFNRKRNDRGLLSGLLSRHSSLGTNVIFFQKRSTLQNIRLVECSIAELMRRIDNVTVSD